MRTERIRHLLEFEWKRVKGLVIAGWLLALLVGVPEILTGLGVEAVSHHAFKAIRVVVQCGLLLNGILLLMVTCLAGRRWRDVRPLRRGEVMTVQVFLLVVAMVVPWLLLALVNLMFLGFPLAVVVKGVAAMAAVVVPLWLGWLLFTAYAGRVTVMIAGLAVLGLIEFAVEFAMFGGIVWPWIDVYGSGAEPSRWVAMGITVLLLFLLYPIARTRRSGMRMGVAVSAVVAGWVAGHVFEVQRHRWLFAGPAETDPVMELRGVFGSVSGANGPQLVLDYEFANADEWSDGLLIWKSAGDGVVRRDEVPVAHEMPPAGGNSTHRVRWWWQAGLGELYGLSREERIQSLMRELDEGSMFYPEGFSHGEEIGFKRPVLLPEAPRSQASSWDRLFMARSRLDPLRFGVVDGNELGPGPAEFAGTLLCSSLRYRQVAALEPGQAGSLYRGADAILEVRSIGDWKKRSGETPYRIALTLPLMGEDVGDQYAVDPLSRWGFVFHYPEDGVYIQAHRNRTGRTRSVGGVERWRTGLDLVLSSASQIKALKGKLPRLLVFRPEVRRIGRRKVQASAMVSGDRQEPGQYGRLINEWLSANHPERWRGRRPDPGTAGVEDVGAWLRLFPNREYRDRVFAYDVAEFAGTHGSLLLKASERGYPLGTLEKGYEWGAPEDQRGELISMMDMVSWAPDVIVRRGWASEAAEPLDEALRDGALTEEWARFGAYMGSGEAVDRILEEIAKGESLPLYEIARQVPGIETRLDAAVDAALRAAPAKLKRRLASHGNWIGPNYWDVPLAHGHPEAVAGLIDGVRDATDLGFEVGISPYLVGNVHAGVEWLFVWPERRAGFRFLAEMKADDFRWDPVLRRWIHQEKEVER